MIIYSAPSENREPETSALREESTQINKDWYSGQQTEKKIHYVRYRKPVGDSFFAVLSDFEGAPILQRILSCLWTCFLCKTDQTRLLAE